MAEVAQLAGSHLGQGMVQFAFGMGKGFAAVDNQNLAHESFTPFLIDGRHFTRVREVEKCVIDHKTFAYNAIMANNPCANQLPNKKAKTMKTAILSALLLVAGAAQAQSHLEDIRASKTLKVCTTGDYKPYSFLRSNGAAVRRAGISMAQSLAASLGANVQWVPTTCERGFCCKAVRHCDGRRLGDDEASAIAWFAQPLGVDGKIPAGTLR